MRDTPSVHQCPRCHRKLTKIRVRDISRPFIPKHTGTFKYWKCRVCNYRETDNRGKILVLTYPGGRIEQ